MPNRLALETSPYLLQHAENPVDWYPWGPEALGLALELDRPILLSVGYSACHWCHVMEHESFEDDVTAALMNEHFVNIKVDREERPDVDAVYMKAVQTLTGGGGWPMTVFLTPSGKPFYGGTYFPPEPRHGLPSFAQVLQAMERAYREQRDDVTQAAEALTRALRHASEERLPVDGSVSVRVEAPPATADASIFDGAFRALAGAYDPTHGGFGRAPKFPQPTTLEFLLRWYAGRPHDPAGKQALDMVTVTLRKMARGGLRDHLGGGFHRYSVDDRWLVPHFEKMLYDNALLARLYIHAWSVTGDSEMRLAGEDTLDWLLTDMRSPEGGFYSARDADSEGVEGRFYVWSLDEIEEVLGSEDTELFALAYDVTVGGNFEGSNILHRPHDLPAIARRADLSTDELELRLSENRQRLLAARGQRPPPLRDHKVLASWNAFAIRALAEAGGALGRRDYLDAAEATLDFLLTDMRPDGRLMHVWTDGQAKISGFLQDYGAVGNAVLTVYEATLEPRWLGELRAIVDTMLARFRDPGSGLFFDTDGEAPESAELVVRPRDVTDGATPSGTALALELLQRAGRLLDEQTWIGIVQEGLSREEEVVRRFPSALGRLLSVGLNELDPPIEVALIGDREDPALRCLHHEVLRRFIPGRTVAGRRPDEELPEKLPLLRDRTTLEGRPAAYLCEHYVCREPTHDPDVLSGQLDNHGFTAP